jgi:2-polyprenyl-3-methyl-5-hydroxy-6-metoxy-1,4-benzoquinol methylase
MKEGKTIPKYFKNSFVFFEITSKPSPKELESYYAEKYYQSEQGNYEKHYSKEELLFFKNKDEQKKIVIDKIRSQENGVFLDIGCGEGFTLANFEAFGWEVTGVDYSVFGCEKMNPAQSKNLIAGDLYESLNGLIRQKKTFDVVWMNNLLEHVIDSVEILTLSKRLLNKRGVLVIQVPNDFSKYQAFLEAKEYIDKKFWIAYPDHLNYFNRESLGNLCKANGFEEKFVLADFPIDLFLSNKHSNYVLDNKKGKLAHKARVELDNFFHETSPEKTIDMYRAMAELGIGRQVISFFQAN